MRRYVFLLAVPLALAACKTATSFSAGLLGSYDAAVAAEITAIKTGKIPPATVAILASCRKTANDQIQAVVKAETSGQAADPAAAQKALNQFLAVANVLSANAQATVTACS